IDDVVLRDRATGAEGEGILDERVYYLQNWHHDVVALVDTSGAIVERANYDGYGMPIGTFSTNGNRRGYAGYEIDPVLAGHWHVRHRVLRSDLGVWTRRDPASESFDTGLYLYASTAPPNYNDAMGLQPDGVYALLHRSHAAACEGACEWYFWARLSVHPRCPLVMVQQVRNEVACDRCCMNPTSGWVRRSYWERIPVPEVAPREVGGGFWLRSARTDRGIWGAPHESYGVFYQAGEIRTFCRQDLPDSAFDHWDTQVPNGTGYALNEGDAQSLCFGLLVRSGNFDSIGTKPQWWDTVTPRAVGTRLMVYNWGCDCADDKAHNNVYCSDDKGDVPKGIRGE
ncbi:MAG: hypothetical protein KJZ68_12265, partial [Phycisphaerales bacterium]|nr:hypothetical protein [Phycisphaerales bacterium]